MKGLRISAALMATSLVLGVGAAHADEIVVKMLNRGQSGTMVFEPGFVKAKVGDTIKFEATDAGHNAETIPGFLPDGATPIAGKPGQTVEMTVTKEGLYGIRCHPHYGLGMVALIEVGKPANLEKVKTLHIPKRPEEKLEKWYSQL
ncbi:pseudoazurin [Solirhodobacter olei]|uniref:pseudoazurin n=1 Tax=Solirhodobacter olei TaxID=2493082 RepID=UPI000FDA9F77|nr:pseudoazurin [Solirhodobacter olei]